MANDYNYFWASCPADILLMVFKKLGVNSLMNCMNVNKFWRDLGEYYCEHFNLWKDIVQHGTDDEGVTFAEKSVLGWREQFLSAQKWLNVRNVNVHLLHCQTYDHHIKNICVCRDNLIVVHSFAVNYFNINTLELIKVVERSCIKYEETATIIVEVSLPNELFVPVIKDTVIVTITNKLGNHAYTFERVRKINYDYLNSFKVHQNSFYEYSVDNVLWVHTAKETGWETKSLAKYHGPHQFCGIHIFKKDVYILLKSGHVIMADTSCKAFKGVFYFDLPRSYLDSKPFMFHMYCLLLKAPKDLRPITHHRPVCHGKRNDHFVITMDRYGVTCVLEHGHTLLVGYEDGKIEIYITKKLIESDFPELVLNLQTYSNKASQSVSSLSVTSMDVYEDITGHHLFVSTMSNVYELLL